MNYLYNGKELPALPEWDKGTCPYAIIITGVTLGQSDLYCSSEPYIAEAVDGYNQITTERVNLLHYRYRTEEYVSGASDGWERVATSITSHPDPLWTNTDIFYEDGTLYLAASDSIPVTTAAPIDPTSFYFLSGLFFAQKVRLPLVYKQLSLNGLCDINNILLKSLDDYFLIPNEEEE